MHQSRYNVLYILAAQFVRMTPYSLCAADEFHLATNICTELYEFKELIQPHCNLPKLTNGLSLFSVYFSIG